MDHVSDDSYRVVKLDDRWTLHERLCVSSTNDEARVLDPWSVMRAVRQTGGRGRMNRTWYSDEGGLWMSCVVPLEDEARDWGALPLVAGLALLDAMTEYGVIGARLRWPNDLLIGDSKLAGILVERPTAGKAVIGIGVNVVNDIDTRGESLRDTPVRLIDIVSSEKTLNLESILRKIVDKVALRFDSFVESGLSGILDELNTPWKETPRRVELEIDDFLEKEAARKCPPLLRGLFMGIDETGNVLILPWNEEGKISETGPRTIPSLFIQRLKELKAE